jgi:hypothetical protein
MPKIRTALLSLKSKFKGHQKQHQEENIVQKLYNYEYVLPMESEATMYTSSDPSGINVKLRFGKSTLVNLESVNEILTRAPVKKCSFPDNFTYPDGVTGGRILMENTEWEVKPSKTAKGFWGNRSEEDQARGKSTNSPTTCKRYA